MTVLEVDITARRSNARDNPGLRRRFYPYVKSEEAQTLLHFTDMWMLQPELKQPAIA